MHTAATSPLTGSKLSCPPEEALHAGAATWLPAHLAVGAGRKSSVSIQSTAKAVHTQNKNQQRHSGRAHTQPHYVGSTGSELVRERELFCPHAQHPSPGVALSAALGRASHRDGPVRPGNQPHTRMQLVPQHAAHGGAVTGHMSLFLNRMGGTSSGCKAWQGEPIMSFEK